MRPFAAVPRVVRASLVLVASVVPAFAAAQALPDAKTLMDKHNAAIGGRGGIDKYQSVHMTATMNIAAMGMDAQMELFRAKPNKLVQKIIIGPVGEIVTGYDGKVGWSTNPMAGATVMEGDMLKQIQAQADFFSNLQDPAVYSTARTVEIADFEGKKCYKVQVVRDGRDGFEFFSVETGLLAGFTGTQPSQQGPTQMTSVIGEYMDVGGIKFPKRIEQRAGPGSATITFSAIEFDTVDPAVFNLPPAVKALIKP